MIEKIIKITFLQLIDCVEQIENEGKTVLIIGKWNMFRLGMQMQRLRSITKNIFLINNV